HHVSIVVKDTYGNTSTLDFKIKKGIITETGKNDSASYHNQKEFQPGFVNIFESEDLQIVLSPEDLYDSVLFVQSKRASASQNSYSDIYSIESGLVPVHSYYSVRIKANKNIPAELENKMLIRRKWKDKTEVVKAIQSSDWYAAKFRNFGDFEIITDDLPPVINGGFRENANLSKSSMIVFTPKDENDEIINFNATLDGNWLRFTNDKGRAFIYKFDEMCTRGSHELIISVQDAAGNTTQKTLHFTR
ncbi:MAG: hypothetical protein M3Z56_08035, partial [Bacteroidota bacterium]|nr:hypothetical protein [Bacteroidota bacterium]